MGNRCAHASRGRDTTGMSIAVNLAAFGSFLLILVAQAFAGTFSSISWPDPRVAVSRVHVMQRNVDLEDSVSYASYGWYVNSRGNGFSSTRRQQP